MKFFTQFNKAIEPCKKLSSDDKVVRSLRDETDINTIFDKYCGSDVLPVVREAKYDSLSYNNALSVVNSVKSDYETLPAKLRAEFGSIDSYVDYLTRASSGDESAMSKMCDLGILKRPLNDVVLDTLPTGSTQEKELVNQPASGQSSAVTTPTESN